MRASECVSGGRVEEERDSSKLPTDGEVPFGAQSPDRDVMT